MWSNLRSDGIRLCLLPLLSRASTKPNYIEKEVDHIMDALRELTKVGMDCEKAVGKWKTLIENIRMLESAIQYMPKSVSLSEDGKRLIYQIADITLFCRFTFLDCCGVLQFGYVEFSAPGGTDVVTGVLYVDLFGNIHNGPDEGHSSYAIGQPEDVQKFYLPKLLEVLKKAMMRRQETICKSTIVRATESVF